MSVMEPIEGGWRVKTSDDGVHYIDIMVMMFNYRITTTRVDIPAVYDRFWCYVGKDQQTLLRTMAAAMAWSGENGTEPEGWDKNGQTGEFRHPEEVKAQVQDSGLVDRPADQSWLEVTTR